MGQLIRVVGPFVLEVRRTASVFQVLSEAIVSQQLSAKAADTIYARVRAAAAGRWTAHGRRHPRDI